MTDRASDRTSTSAPTRSAALRRSVLVGLALALTLAVSSPANAVEEVDHHYVTDTLRIGSTAAEARGYAFDLNNDPNHIPDNALGGFLATIANALSVDGAIASSIQAGDTVILHSLLAHSLSADPLAWWRVYLGTPTPNPVLTGGGMFAVDPTAPSGTALRGSITGGRFLGGPGIVPLRLGLVPGDPPVQIQLVGARVQADCTSLGCSNGKIGGGVPRAQVDSSIIPALARAMQAVIDASCTISTPDSCSATARNLLALFDSNADFRITADELRANFLIAALLAPDVDLLKANGRPGNDGVNDSLSLGLGFTAKEAVFVTPEDPQ
jgi:hypothetical protein